MVDDYKSLKFLNVVACISDSWYIVESTIFFLAFFCPFPQSDYVALTKKKAGVGMSIGVCLGVSVSVSVSIF